MKVIFWYVKGEEKGDKAKNSNEENKIDEANLDKAKKDEIEVQEAKEEQDKVNEAVASKVKANISKAGEAKSMDEFAANGVIRNEATEDKAEAEAEAGDTEAGDKTKESALEILIRQSYPQRVKHSQLYQTVKKPVEQEISRVITRQGTVIKTMLDGSTQILFADGTVIRSPDSGPVIPPPPAPSTPHTEVLPTPEISTKKNRKNTKAALVAKVEAVEAVVQDHLSDTEQPPDALAGTWITTTPLGTQIGTKGSERLDLKPLLAYQATDPVNGTILPMNKGCLFIDEDCSAVYSPEAFEKDESEFISSVEDQQMGKYFMKHNSNTVCEVMDPAGNIFKVMADGSTSEYIATIDDDGKTSESSDTQTPVVYGEHAPRFFIVYADGSGTELLRTRDAEEYLAMAYGDPVTVETVSNVALEEMPEVIQIIVNTESAGEIWNPDPPILTPIPMGHVNTKGCVDTKSSQPGVVSMPVRRDQTILSIEADKRRTPGPPFGMHAWKGLHIEFKELANSSAPIQKCPNVLQIRRLIQYEPVTDELRHKLQLSVKEYIDKIMKQEEEIHEMTIKDPRMEEEKENAADLLKLVMLNEKQREGFGNIKPES
ncbi:hypothetical protein JD844_009950 [Phrynosoma platyrhinos]|uniref:Sperm-associated antigen 17 n=1 Tax=Phrynosoma platyrhinos TaxID=52577 RepID=A0ABQ7TGP1_PHRPL|nr:hypothetical protein JD844_009950 [Phrynosoma platyrhinos]